MCGSIFQIPPLARAVVSFTRDMGCLSSFLRNGFLHLHVDLCLVDWTYEMPNNGKEIPRSSTNTNTFCRAMERYVDLQGVTRQYSLVGGACSWSLLRFSFGPLIKKRDLCKQRMILFVLRNQWGFLRTQSEVVCIQVLIQVHHCTFGRHHFHWNNEPPSRFPR